MWRSLLKIQYTELKLSCGNNPVVKNYIYSNSDLLLYIGSFTSLATWFPCGRGRTLFILGSLGQRSRSPLGNDPVVKNYIYSNSDLDLWPNDPKINRVFPLPLGNHVAKFGKDPMLSCGNDPVVKNSIYSNIDLWPNGSKVKITVTINIIFDNRVVSAR
jgi:hypothetical protein